MTVKQRNKLLAEMTDEVGRAGAAQQLRAERRARQRRRPGPEPAPRPRSAIMRRLERDGQLDRALEFLPTDRQIRELLNAGQGLTQPELAVLLAYTKITVADELLAHRRCRTTRTCAGCCTRTSRPRCASSSPSRSTGTRCAARSSRPCWSTTRSTPAVRPSCTGCARRPAPRSRRSSGRRPRPARSSGSAEVWDAVEALDNKVAADVQTRIRLHSRRLVERGTRWLLDNRPQPLELAETIDFFSERVGAGLGRAAQAAARRGPGVVPADPRRADRARASRTSWPRGWPGFSSAFPALDIVAIADRTGKDPLDVAEVYYDLADRLRITQLMDRIIELPRADRWQSMARASIREDLYAAHAALTADVLPCGNGASTPEQRFKAWEQKNAAILGRARTTLEEIQGSDDVRPGEPVGGDADDADAAAYAFVGGRR